MDDMKLLVLMGIMWGTGYFCTFYICVWLVWDGWWVYDWRIYPFYSHARI